MSSEGGRLNAVAPSVWVATSRRYATTSTVIVGRDGDALVVDPAWDADELVGIATGLRSLELTCAAGLATHVHYDHVLWHPHLGSPPRYASPWTAWAVETRRAQVLAPLVGDLPDELLELAGRLVPVPGGREPSAVPDPARDGVSAIPPAYELPWPGHDVLLHEHDAHAPAHLAVEVVDLGVLVAGDMLSDVELPMPDAAAPSLEAYLQGLDRLAEVVARCDLLIPGHGTPTSEPLSRLDADRRYLDDLLTRGDSDDPRKWLPDMADLHAANVRRAAAQRAGQVGWGALMRRWERRTVTDVATATRAAATNAAPKETTATARSETEEADSSGVDWMITGTAPTALSGTTGAGPA